MWEFGSNSDEPQYAFSPWGKEKLDYHFQPFTNVFAPYGDGHSARYQLISPVNMSPGKKYPLVIGTASYEWTPIAHAVYAQALARCGAFVALVDYHWDSSKGVGNYTNHVLAIYDQLATNSNVDKSRVYLFAFSAGTQVAKDLVEQYPGRWRGLMLMNPSVLPDPEECVVQNVLLTAGSAEDEEGRFSGFQEDLNKNGIPSTSFIFQGERHVIRGQEAFYNRTLLMIDTVFEQ
jgi:predicted esterase